jgi:RNA polymerase sigma-70 factor, ECF subfamily
MFTTSTCDKQLVVAYINGNEQAFELLLHRHKNNVFHYVLSKVKDRDLADDIFQDTFIKVIKTLKAGNYNEEGKFLPWVLRIAHNLVVDHFRRVSKVRMISESTSYNEEFNIFSVLAQEERNVEQQITYDELENQMVELVQHLPESQREILEMRIFQDMSFKEIADLKGISINTALGRMRYALINIRKLIEKHNLVVDIY